MDVFIPVIRPFISAKPKLGVISYLKNLKIELLPVFKRTQDTTAMYERLLTLGMAHYYFKNNERHGAYFDSAELD